MSTKNNPGKFDCYAAAEPDEPMFVLLARDLSAPYLVRVWADIHFINPDKKAEALAVADEMEKWRIAKKEAHTAKWRLAKKAASKL